MWKIYPRRNVLENMQLEKIRISSRDRFRELMGLLASYLLTKLNEDTQEPNMVAFSRDPISFGIQIKGFYELDELKLIIKFLDKSGYIKGIALDVGANIGNHSLFFDKYFDGVESFEPHPVTFELLKINAKLGKNINPHNLGASSCEEKLTLYNTKSSYGGASFHPHWIGDSLEKNEVLLVNLDSINYLMEIDIGLIKIDTEGHELDALKGAEEIIKKNMPPILFEQHPIDFLDNGVNPVMDYLKSLSYSKFAIITRSHEGIINPKTIIGTIYRHLARLCLGYEYKLILPPKIQPDFYPIILALP